MSDESPLTPEQIQGRRTMIYDQAHAALRDPSRVRYWWWLSFVQGDRFLGVALVDAPDEAAAPILRAQELRCNPGGAVAMVGPLPEDKLPNERYRRRLLTTAADLEGANAAVPHDPQDDDPDKE